MTEEKVEKNTTDISNTEEVHGKLSAEGDEISQAFSKAAGHAKEKAKEITEKASELMTKENLEKASGAVQQTLEKVESYNKNQLFDKITFGVSLLGELVFVYFLWNAVQLLKLSSGTPANGLQALGDGIKGLQSIMQAVSFISLFIIALFVIASYNTYTNIKAKKSWTSNINITVYATLLLTLLGNFFAKETLKAVSTIVEAMSGNFANLVSLTSLDSNVLRGGSTTLMVFYTLATLANTGTLYFLYQKLFKKK